MIYIYFSWINNGVNPKKTSILIRRSSLVTAMSIDRRIPLSTVAYQAVKDRAGDFSLSEYVSAVLIQVLQPVNLPASIYPNPAVSNDSDREESATFEDLEEPLC